MQNEYSAGRSGTATGGVGGAVYHATEGSISTSVLSHFGPFYKDRTDKGPKWQRTEVDVQIGTKDRSG